MSKIFFLLYYIKLLRTMKKFLNNIKFWLVSLGAVTLSFAFATAAKAAGETVTSQVISEGIGWALNKLVISPLVGVLGNVALILIDFLVKVVSYTGYMTSPAVVNGWIVVRDVANMFFVAMFLVIAIGTIVNPGKFQGMRAIVRLLLYAIFVNFSKTIAGLCIDASNIVMLTFVNGFKAAAGGNFVDALGMRSLVTINPNEAAPLTGLIGAQLVGLIMMVIIVVLIGIILIAMVMRMITLWFLIVVSPLAFAMGGTEMTKPRYAEWWKRFSAQLTTGPLVAFFLWLTLATVQQQPVGADLAGTGPGSISGAQTAGAKEITSCTSEFCKQSQIMRFVIAALMLLGGLMFAKEFEGVGGELAGAALNKGKGAMNYVGKRALKLGAIGVGVAAAPVLGGAIAGGYLMSRTETGKGILGRAGTGIGRGISAAQNKNIAARWAMRLTGIGAAGRLATSLGNKQLAAADKTARDRMQYYSQDQVEEVASSSLSSYPEKRAAALRIAKDKDYRNANINDADPEKRAKAERRLKILQQSIKTLSEINGDKDADDAIKEVKEVRPEALAMGPKPVNFADFGHGFNIREGASKLRLDLMSEANRNEFLHNLRPDDLKELYKRTSADGKRAIDAYRMGSLPTRPELDTAVKSGQLTADDIADLPAERYVPGRTDGSTETNIDLARSVLENGKPGQIRAFLSREDAHLFGEAMRDALRGNLNFSTGAGFDGHTGTMTDDNMRLAEGAIIANIGANAQSREKLLKDTYRVKDDGTFVDPRMESSFVAALSSPRKVDMLMSLPESAYNDETKKITQHIISSLQDQDLVDFASRATTAEDDRRLNWLLKTVAAAGNAGNARAASLAQNASIHPDLGHHMS